MSRTDERYLYDSMKYSIQYLLWNCRFIELNIKNKIRTQIISAYWFKKWKWWFDLFQLNNMETTARIERSDHLESSCGKKKNFVLFFYYRMFTDILARIRFNAEYCSRSCFAKNPCLRQNVNSGGAG